ncbi:MAG: CoA transferase [Chloroflexota bacterium]|nr:CoA transferase [Chloroflexota bacterium]
MDISGPLTGIKVLDLSEDIAGSFCARLLADYGADVLKVEPPSGSAMRGFGPFYHDDPHPEKSLFFLILNLNKKGITLNLDSAAGRRLLLELIPHVDLVVESYQPGYLAGLGIGYDELARINPGLVMTSITPFGQTGPYSEYAGEEIVSYAMGMVMGISGVQGRPPLKHGGFQAQYQGGLFGAGATAMALFAQDRHGIGQHVDVSITECVASTMMATQTIYPFIGGVQIRRADGTMWENPMPCKDGWIIVQAGGGATWEDIADFFQAPELLEPRFADRAQRVRNGPAMDQVVLDAIRDREKWELFPKAAEKRMLFGLVQTPSELAECPQLESREFYRETEHPVIGRVKVPAELFRMSPDGYQLRMPAPTLGQHNREVFVDGLGYSAAQLSVMRQSGII